MVKDVQSTDTHRTGMIGRQDFSSVAVLADTILMEGYESV